MTKRILALLLVTMTLLCVSTSASARKFGGGHSWGHSYHTSRSYGHSYSGSSSSYGSRSRLGFGHGFLGGMVTGGILGSLFGHHGYGYGGGGFGFGSLILWALIIWLAWRFFRKRSGQSGSVGSMFNSRSQSSASFDLPPGFDVNNFLEGAKHHYHVIQTAWNHNDLATLRQYLIPELYQQMANERAKFGTAPMNDRILYVDATLVRAEQPANMQQLSVHFAGQYVTDDGRQAKIDEIWHLCLDTSRPNNNWLIEGIDERSEQ
ncbi:Tim44 domain-containing protein [Celerinatantimonas sp. MCCC 1A17872]|uniref:Tim44 domain-containing protein n=1 Tax=Celerinatantimonas sp. MCCC 1A17872 TaxID=3177514 RepID=UPI0038CAACED